jgi:hypothetical protein
MVFWVSLANLVFAVAAAILWFCSARVYIPVLKSGWGTLTSIMKNGSIQKSETPFRDALTKAARLNMWAALFTGLSALAQFILGLMQKLPITAQ